VYHAVVIRFDLVGGTAEVDVAAAVASVLALAREDGIGTLALPLLGAGVGGLAPERSLGVILEALESAAAFDRPLDIEIVVRDDHEHASAAALFASLGDRAAREREVNEAALAFLAEIEGRRG
jgi:O-acetyl-ADP-ribose deacetylase (regulator of RNase III)